MAVQKTTPSSSDYTSSDMALGHPVGKGRVVWPSPPLAPGDVDVDASFGVQDFNVPYNCMAAECSYSAVSPGGGWCASTPAINQPLVEQYQAQGASGNININMQDLARTCTPSSSADLGLDSTDGFLLALNCEDGDPGSHLWGVDITPSMNTFGNSPVSQSDSVVESPASTATVREAPSASRQKVRSVPSASPPSDSTTDSGGNEKADEPYAKLIYKAIMTRPNYSMTLQEIYQWFREHTAKAVTETGGWQNSIRHNLSMNAAFRKRDKVVPKAPRNMSSISEESKRVNEWVLEDWAIRDGVQSTTRYRQKTYARRARSAGRNGIEAWAIEHSVKRALSGRKGGCATRATRVGKASSYGQVMQFPSHSQPFLDLRSASPSCAAVADIHTMRPALQGQYGGVMSSYTSLDTFQDGLVGGCGGDSTSEPQHLRPASYSNFELEQTMANSGGMHHANHTGPYDEPVATTQGRRTPAMEMPFNTGDLPRFPGIKYEDTDACASTLPICRPYQPLQGSPYVWWNQTGQ
ncbi:hypothetical protein ED733_005714 [Metarhizium rileyi]|uniref:Fork-head domain-containing protein n=1 Tax=Metarhizium rileyi (strain RCEF 4871) TaxID=1649241 RepID=A0A5C6GFZ7_METRR|nr:hypothetical protein ED733_005714 [Metarhizium rileyi]